MIVGYGMARPSENIEYDVSLLKGKEPSHADFHIGCRHWKERFRKVNRHEAKCRLRLLLIRFAGVRFHSTSVWRRFSVRGGGLTRSRGVEYEKGWRQGHGLKRNAGDVGRACRKVSFGPQFALNAVRFMLC